MDIRQLEMLLAVAETGSYAKAGERLWVTHSAIHRQIKLLEDEVKSRIFVKNGRRMELTDVGRTLRDLARRITSEVASTQQQIASRNQLLSGRLRIGTSTTALTFFLPTILSRFRTSYPDVDLHIMTGTADRVLDAIRTGHLDAGIVMGPCQPTCKQSGFVHEFLYTERFNLIVSREHRLASEHVEGKIKLSQLSDCLFIMHARSSYVRLMVNQICEEAHLTPKVSMELDNEEIMERMVAINMGIAFVSRKRITQDERILALRLADRTVACEVALVYAESAFPPPAVTRFAEMCRAAAAQGGTPAKRILRLG